VLVIIIGHLPISRAAAGRPYLCANGVYVVSALVGSLLFSLTLVPLFRCPPRPNSARKTTRSFAFASRCISLSCVCLERRAAVLVTAVVVLAGSLAFAAVRDRIPARAQRGCGLDQHHARRRHSVSETSVNSPACAHASASSRRWCRSCPRRPPRTEPIRDDQHG